MMDKKTDYDLGTERSGFKVLQGPEGTSFNLETGELDISNAVAVADEVVRNNPAVITKEQERDDKIKKLEETVSTLEDTLTSLVTRLSDVEIDCSVIVLTANTLQSEINMKVDKDKVINSINISEEDVRIKGSKIHVDKNTLIEHGTFKN